MEKFTEFWGGIWEKEEVTPMLPWMDNVKEELKTSINTVKEFTIEEERLIKIVKKRKNWTSPGIDGIQNYWWKKFRTAPKTLKRAFERAEVDNNMIPQWWPAGRTVLIQKTKELGDVKNYRPITCLNTSYKLMTGLIGKYMRDHAMENEIWDEGQLGGVEGVLGTVDQLLIDVCIMEEVRSYHRNLAVAYYDYKKAYDKVHHDWMLRVFNWMGIPKNVTALLKALMVKWKTRLEVWNDGQKQVSRWIQIVCGFLQGDSYSPVGFCLTEVPVGKLLKASKGYKMGRPGQRNIKRTHSLFIDDLKTYQENHKMLQIVNETIVQASNDTGACYGVSKCAEIIFERGQMVKGEGLEVLHERMKTIDPDENVTYKFLGVEQADGIKTKEVFERIKTEVENRLELLIKTELNDRNLMKAINSKVIPVAEYPMNVCRFSKEELLELDQIIKRQLRKNNMLERQSSDESCT